ncbi:MAG: DUF4446 family protein [Candidatus Pacebacteria bacterium]|nr:DUF4446 family protein [Candidatus Paceibacterota bacterium]
MEIITDLINFLTNKINFVFDNQNIINFIIIIVIPIITLIIIRQFLDILKIKKQIRENSVLNINEKVIKKIIDINKDINKLSVFQLDARLSLNKLEKKTEEINDINIIKYNPYKDMGVGGNQSFSVSFLNKKGDGIILTSLYSREKNRILIKKIQNFNSEQELSNEESGLLKIK